jgi:HlyD family secretion protein
MNDRVRVRIAGVVIAAALLAACTAPAPPVALGTLEWDQVALVADASEPVLEIAVRENDVVAAGALLLRLDDRRARAELAQADAEIARLDAVLDELRRGARIEAIDEARARLARARALADNARQEFERQRDLRERRLASPADFDRARANTDAAASEQRGAAAALEQLLAGTRIEQLAQAEAARAAAQARREMLAVGLERLTVRAPRGGRIDALPVEVGDQPARGATLATLLVGDAPHARVFIPAPLRVGLAPDARFEVRVEGLAAPLAGRLRHVREQASFTPYYALAGDDASRLAWVAEIDLDGEAARRLPAGLPLTATPVAATAPQ